MVAGKVQRGESGQGKGNWKEMDGLAVVTLKDSKVKQRLLSCADVQPGMTVQGEITTVEHFGAFVKLSDGVKALCPLQHMSEFQRTKPSVKFKVGADEVQSISL